MTHYKLNHKERPVSYFWAVIAVLAVGAVLFTIFNYEIIVGGLE